MAPIRRRRSWRRRLFRWFAALFLFGVVLTGVGVAIAFSYIESVPLPPDRVQVQTAYVYARGGERLRLCRMAKTVTACRSTKCR
jgi:hypothetical protein